MTSKNLSPVKKVSILSSVLLFQDDLFVFTVRVLLDYGADPNLKDGIGNTPLHLGKEYKCATCAGSFSRMCLFAGRVQVGSDNK